MFSPLCNVAACRLSSCCQGLTKSGGFTFHFAILHAEAMHCTSCNLEPRHACKFPGHFSDGTRIMQAAAQAAAQTTMRGAYRGDNPQDGEDKSWAAMMKDGLELMQEAERPLPTIIYASRTHSQLAQVMGELSSSGYR